MINRYSLICCLTESRYGFCTWYYARDPGRWAVSVYQKGIDKQTEILLRWKAKPKHKQESWLEEDFFAKADLLLCLESLRGKDGIIDCLRQISTLAPALAISYYGL